MCKIFLTIRKLSPKIISSVNPKYLNNSFMKRSPIISKKQNSNLMIHNVNWSKDMRLLHDHLISKSLNFFHAHNTTTKVSKLAIFHNLKLEGKGGED